MTTRETKTRRLSVEDWIEAALEIMAADGIGGVKIQRLCDELGVTKGSFYWHFTDLDSFLEAITERWTRGDGILQSASDPKAALKNAVSSFLDRRLGRLERAMRDWSRTDVRARAAIKSADARTFDALVTCFETLGFVREDADVRAKILFYAGVGFGDVGPIGDRNEPARQLETLVDLLTN